MRTSSIVSALIWFWASSPATCGADESQDVIQLERLISQIENALPNGWGVKFELANDRCGESRAMLVIKSDEPLPIEYLNQIGLPGGSAEDPEPPPDISKGILTITFTFVAFMSPEKLAENRKRNESFEDQRIQFITHRLRKERFAYKSPPPWPPTAYRPESPEEAQLLREYALLWLATEPQPLPTHYYGSLSLQTNDLTPPTSIKIHDANRDKEFHEIINALGRILTLYDSPRTRPTSAPARRN